MGKSVLKFSKLAEIRASTLRRACHFWGFHAAWVFFNHFLWYSDGEEKEAQIMDQIKIGKFIAQQRKEQSMTQRQLADILGISDKTVSKWETGNGLPEVSLMMPLCDSLKINVNELLSGERLTDFNYKVKAEENIMDLVNERAESKKKIILSAIVCALTPPSPSWALTA